MYKTEEELIASFEAISLLTHDAGMWTNEVHIVVRALARSVNIWPKLPEPFNISKPPVQLVNHNSDLPYTEQDERRRVHCLIRG